MVRNAVQQLIDALQAFFDQLAAVSWAALGIAVGLQVLRLGARAVAWRTILAAAYPETRVPFWGVFGSYAAGVGVNAVVPARGGDVVKLLLARRTIEGSSYATLASTLLLETVFDALVAGALLGWALTLGAFPSLSDLPDLPAIDWHWPLNHPWSTVAITVVWTVVIGVLIARGVRSVREFRARVRQGFAILRQPRRFLTGVISWQALSWVLRAASVFFFLRAFHVPATAENTVLVLSVQSLSTLLPFTPGGIGTQQGFLVYVFRDATISKTALLSFSVGMHVTVTVLNALIGFIAIVLMLRTVRWKRQVLAEKEKAAVS